MSYSAWLKSKERLVSLSSEKEEQKAKKIKVTLSGKQDKVSTARQRQRSRLKKLKKFKTFKEETSLNERIINHDVIIAFGRMQPPTIGHYRIIEEMQNLAEKHNASTAFFISQSEKGHKNPIPFELKDKILERSFPETNFYCMKDNVFETLRYLYAGGVKNPLILCGSDRKKDYERICEYNNVFDENNPKNFFKFESITVKEIQRNIEEDEVSNISGTSIRNAIQMSQTLNEALEVCNKYLPENSELYHEDIINHIGIKKTKNKILVSENFQFKTLNEKAISQDDRVDRSRSISVNRGKLSIGRTTKAKQASGENILRIRAKKAARRLARTILSGDAGVRYNKGEPLSQSQKEYIDKKVSSDEGKALVNHLTSKIMVDLRQKESGRIRKNIERRKKERDKKRKKELNKESIFNYNEKIITENYFNNQFIFKDLEKKDVYLIHEYLKENDIPAYLIMKDKKPLFCIGDKELLENIEYEQRIPLNCSNNFSLKKIYKFYGFESSINLNIKEQFEKIEFLEKYCSILEELEIQSENKNHG